MPRSKIISSNASLGVGDYSQERREADDKNARAGFAIWTMAAYGFIFCSLYIANRKF